ncbi:MAG: effector binding domain-containing protein [Anaerolineae bacterium]|nr:effector binding domain-containing protein [Gemmatimonadaceae bacterium]
MHFDTLDYAAFTVVGIATRTAGDPPAEIGRLWKRLFDEGVLQRIPNKASSDLYSLYTEYQGDHTQPYSVVLGCAVTHVDELPHGLVAKAVPAATNARLTGIPARPDAIGPAWQQVHQAGLPRSFIADFDLHHAAGGAHEGFVDIYVGVKTPPETPGADGPAIV